MAVRAHAHQHQVEQRSNRVQELRAVERFQAALVTPCRLVWVVPVCWYWVNVGSGRATIEKRPPRGTHIVQGVIGWDETLVTNEPMHALPGNSACHPFGCEQLIEP